MSSEPFEEIGETLKKAASALREADIPFLLGGSLASWARGGPETFKDLDFMLKPEDAERALETLGKIGMRTDKPPEGWLYKAYDRDVLIDLIFEPRGLDMTDEVIARGEQLEVLALPIRVMALDDVMATKLLSLTEHHLDYSGLLSMSRALRERIDWESVRERTAESPYAKAFFTMVEELGISPRPGARDEGEDARPTQAHVRVIND
ncbi:MAG: nucleotidyltransferase family protein [Thermoleophilaceae bacterium]